MPTKIYKDGCRCVITEYSVGQVDESGDMGDVDFFETEKEAVVEASNQAIAPGQAVVVEKRIHRYPSHLFNEPTSFTVLATFGSRKALMDGGWIE
jgi:hypothetical protein